MVKVLCNELPVLLLLFYGNISDSVHVEYTDLLSTCVIIESNMQHFPDYLNYDYHFKSDSRLT